MVAKSKISPEEWVKIRATWENDPREGYTWIIAEFELLVSRAAVGKVSARENWKKIKVALKKKPAVAQPSTKAPVAKPSKAKPQAVKAKKPAPKVAPKAKVAQIKPKAVPQPSKAKQDKPQSKSTSLSVVKVAQDNDEKGTATLDKSSKSDVGRPTSFKEEYVKQVYRLSLVVPQTRM